MPSGARVRFRPILRVPTTGWCGLAYRIANSDDMPLFSGNGLKPSEPSIEVLKYHKVKVTFSYLGKAALYFRPKGVPATPPPSPPNEEGLRQIVNDLGLRLRARDGRFEPSKHLSVVFEHNLGQVFASFQDRKSTRLNSSHSQIS